MFRDLKEYQNLQKLYEEKVSKPENLVEKGNEPGSGVKSNTIVKSREEVGLKNNIKLNNNKKINTNFDSSKIVKDIVDKNKQVNVNKSGPDLDAISKYTNNNRKEVTMKDFTPEKKVETEIKKEIKKEPEVKPLTTREKFNKKFIRDPKTKTLKRRGSPTAQRAENLEKNRLRAQEMAKKRIELKKKAEEEAKKSNMKEQYDAYDMVLEYLLSTEQAATIEEANYVMMQLDEENIQEIVKAGLGAMKAIGRFGAKSPLHFAALAGTTAALAPSVGKGLYKAKETAGNVINKITNFDPIGDARKENIKKKQREYEKKSGTTKDDGYFYDPTVDGKR